MVTTGPEVLDAVLTTRLASVQTSLPGVIVTYNKTTQRALVRPAVRVPVATSEPGVFAMETLPDVPNVKVVWPSGKDGYFALDLEPGDGVELRFMAVDPTTFFRTGEVSDPADLRRFSLAHAVAYPGLNPNSQALPGIGVVAPNGAIGGSSDAAALASIVDSIGQVIGLLADPVNPAQTMAAVVAIIHAFQLVYPAGVGSVASEKLLLGG